MEGLIFGILRYVVSRRSRIVTAKLCTKKRDTRAKLLLWLSNLFAFVTFPLPSPSSDFKVPNIFY